jgi:hypothetical protein
VGTTFDDGRWAGQEATRHALEIHFDFSSYHGFGACRLQRQLDAGRILRCFVAARKSNPSGECRSHARHQDRRLLADDVTLGDDLAPTAK